MLPRYWFHFDHEPAKHISLNDEAEVEVVDIIGVVD